MTDEEVWKMEVEDRIADRMNADRRKERAMCEPKTKDEPCLCDGGGVASDGLPEIEEGDAGPASGPIGKEGQVSE